MKPDHLTVAGGLLELMMRVQDGRATCLYAARLIEDMHEGTMRFHEARAQSALDCNADLNRQFFAKSLELDKAQAALKDAHISIAAIHCRLAYNGSIDESLRLTLRDECEHVIPDLKALRPNADPV